MVCAQCGAISDEGQRFCYNCGARLEPQPAGAPQPPVQTAPPPSLTPPAEPQPLGQPVGYGQGPAAYGPVAVPNSNLAIISLVSGILTWVLLPVVAAIVAVITGHMARREIRQSGGQLAGDGLALIGLILGYAQIALAFVGVCAGLLFFVIAVAAAA
jgi:hypothetical protein